MLLTKDSNPESYSSNAFLTSCPIKFFSSPPPPGLRQRDTWRPTQYLNRRYLSVTDYGFGYGLCSAHNKERLIVVQHSGASGVGAARSSRRPVLYPPKSRLVFSLVYCCSRSSGCSVLFQIEHPVIDFVSGNKDGF